MIRPTILAVLLPVLVTGCGGSPSARRNRIAAPPVAVVCNPSPGFGIRFPGNAVTVTLKPSATPSQVNRLGDVLEGAVVGDAGPPGITAISDVVCSPPSITVEVRRDLSKPQPASLRNWLLDQADVARVDGL